MRSVQAPSPAEPRTAGDGCACGHCPDNRPADQWRTELTERELAALIAVASGLTAKRAARLMGTSDRTLRRAQRDAADRLGVPTPMQAVVIAAAAGLIDMTHVRDGTLPGFPEPERATGAAAKRAMFERLRNQGIPVRRAAEEAGVAYSTGTAWNRAMRAHEKHATQVAAPDSSRRIPRSGPSPERTAAAQVNGRAAREQAIAAKAARLARAVPLFEQDLPVRVIAKRLGVTTVTVYTYRREWRAGEAVRVPAGVDGSG